MFCDKEPPPSSLLLPLLLVSFAFAGFLVFQTCMLIADRSTINSTYLQQEKPLEQVEKVNAQVNALVKRVMVLAKQGNKNAQGIIDELKKAGVNFEASPQGQQPSDVVQPGAK